jgi:hypothetical protein
MTVPTAIDQLSAADQRLVADQLAGVIAEMTERYGARNFDGMFCATSQVFALTDLACDGYIDISALTCQLTLVERRDRTAVEAHSPAGMPSGEKRLVYIQLLEPLVTRDRLGETGTRAEREDWLWATSHSAKIGQLGYSPATA